MTDQGKEKYAKDAIKILITNIKKADISKLKIYYSDLANEIRLPETYIKNPGFQGIIASIMETVGKILVTISKKMDKPLPMLQSLVCAKKTDLSGQGLEYFIEGYKTAISLCKKGKFWKVNIKLLHVSDTTWDEVLKQI